MKNFLAGMRGWVPSPSYDADSAHIGWATAAMLGSLQAEMPLWLAILLFVSYAVIKEFWWDWLAPHGEHDTLTGSIRDFAGYMTGIGNGVLGHYHFYVALPFTVVLLVVLAVIDYYHPSAGPRGGRGNKE